MTIMKNCIKNFLLESGELIESGANKPIILDAPDSIYYIISGYADIFFAPLKINGDIKIIGKRHFYYSANADSAFFSMNSSAQNLNCAFVAVPSIDCQLVKYSFKELMALIETRGLILIDEFIKLLESWIISLNFGAADNLNLSADLIIDDAGAVKISKQQKLKSQKRVFWLNAAADFFYFDTLEAGGDKTNKYFPISEYSYIQFANNAEIQLFATIEILKNNSLAESLDYYYRILLQFENINRSIFIADEYNILNNRLNSSEAAAERAENILNSAIVQKQASEILIENQPLLSAVVILAKQLNIQLTVPPNYDERKSKEPLNELLNYSSIRNRKVKLLSGWRKTLSSPLLAFTKNDEPVLLLPQPNGKIIIHNTATDEKQIADNFNEKNIREYGYKFYRTFEDKPLKLTDILAFVYPALKKDLKKIIKYGLIAGLITIAAPLAVKIIINSILPNADFTPLIYMALALFSVLIGSAIFEIAKNIGLLKLEGIIDETMQSAVMDRVLKLPVEYINRYSSGELVERTLSVMLIRQKLSGITIISILYSLFSLLNYIILFCFNAKLAIIIGFLTIAFLAFNIIANFMQLKYMKPYIVMESKMSSFMLQLIAGVSKIKVACAENFVYLAWAKMFGRQRKWLYDSRLIGQFIHSLNSSLPLLLVSAVFAYLSVFRAIKISPADFSAFLFALMTFAMSNMIMFNSATQLIYIFPLYDNLKDIITAKPETTKSENQKNPGVLKGAIDLCDITFRYHPADAPALKNVSFSINPGEFAAVVGTSGSGKSTLIKILLGFYNIESGAVLFDKQDINALDINALRRQIGVVLQNCDLMTGNILFNIAGSLPITLEDAWNAAELAGIAEDIREMPMEMNTVINAGGQTFSGGQKQRILIARALAANPKILLLDEATSALDNNVQSEVIKNLEKLKITRIIVAHRLTSIMKADKIIVMDKGEVVQIGKYNDLINCDGVFKKLAERQKI